MTASAAECVLNAAVAHFMITMNSVASYEVRVPFMQLRYKALEHARQADKTWDHQLPLWQVGYAPRLASARALCLFQKVMLPPYVMPGNWQSDVLCAHAAHLSMASPITWYKLKLIQNEAYYHMGPGCINLAFQQFANAGALAGAARPRGRASAGAALCRHGCGAARAARVLPRSRCRCSPAGRL